MAIRKITNADKQVDRRRDTFVNRPIEYKNIYAPAGGGPSAPSPNEIESIWTWYVANVDVFATVDPNVPAVDGGRMSSWESQSPVDAPLSQAFASEYPYYFDDPTSKIALRHAGTHNLNINPAVTPAAGLQGTLVIATSGGTAAVELNVQGYNYFDLSKTSNSYFPDTNGECLAVAIATGTLTKEECASVSTYFQENVGSKSSYAGVTNFESFFRGWSDIKYISALDTSTVTSMGNTFRDCTALKAIPLLDTSNVVTWTSTFYGCTTLTGMANIDMSSATAFNNTWQNCYQLTDFPVTNTPNLASVASAWLSCINLTSFPLLDVSSCLNFSSAWYGCSSLATFPAAMFDSCQATNYTNAFRNCALTAQSMENITVSIAAAAATYNLTNGTLDMYGGTSAGEGSYSEATQEALDYLDGNGWQVTVN
jgi:hypothetical protein